MKWRWDQGRLEYFNYSNIRSIANVFLGLEGIDLEKGGEDILRTRLELETGLPFLPNSYTVWRNYARVFQCAMLATKIEGRLFVTDLCRKLKQPPTVFSSDEYFNFIFSRFALPFPAFKEYNASVTAVFPFAAIMKFIMSRPNRVCSTDDVINFIVANKCTGVEDLQHYATIKPKRVKSSNDEKRQIREMLAFMGQASYLKWLDKSLYIDSSDYDSILTSTSPNYSSIRKLSPLEEFISMTSISPSQDTKFDVVLSDKLTSDPVFKEGGKAFVTHSKIERSPLIRQHFFHIRPEVICDACKLKPRERYPWTDNILELHHILPLSTTLNVGGTTTSLDDLSPLCPSCHRSIHDFYQIKLSEWGVPDFGSKTMAKDIYEMAKREIRL